MTTATVIKFKPIAVFHADIENLESKYNCKKPLLKKFHQAFIVKDQH